MGYRPFVMFGASARKYLVLMSGTSELWAPQSFASRLCSQSQPRSKKTVAHREEFRYLLRVMAFQRTIYRFPCRCFIPWKIDPFRLRAKIARTGIDSHKNLVLDIPTSAPRLHAVIKKTKRGATSCHGVTNGWDFLRRKDLISLSGVERELTAAARCGEFSGPHPTNSPLLFLTRT